MIRVGITGGTGRLGKEIALLLADAPDIRVGAVITRKGSPYAGHDLGGTLGLAGEGIAVMDDLAASGEYCDVYIDCTHADAFEENDAAYRQLGKPVVIATTGFEPGQLERVHKLAETTAVILCPNFSIGVLRFLKVVRAAAEQFGLSDIDIIEHHHKHKKDSPSGTARKIAQTIQEAGAEGPIRFHSVRAGQLVGEHRVYFTTTENERIEVSHQSYSRDTFAEGVRKSVHWIHRQGKGLYGLEEVYGTGHAEKEE